MILLYLSLAQFLELVQYYIVLLCAFCTHPNEKCPQFPGAVSSCALYQNQRTLPPRDSDIDTISGSFLLRFFGSVMQNSRDYPPELVFGEGKLQDFVSLNQMLNLLPNG